VGEPKVNDGPAQEKPSPEEIFDDLRLFNHVVVSDEALTSRLLESGFE
jgi:hypothetical protein